MARPERTWLTAKRQSRSCSVNVAGGGQVTVNFNRDTAGATVTIDGATSTIGSTVDVLAE